jgi:DNA-binding CsgD family transcriptional regulator
MNRPHPRARIIVRARDPVLRDQILERLDGLGDVEAGPVLDGHEAEIETVPAETVVTPREMEVLGLLAEGLANKEIAARLGFSTHTAKFHVESLLRKLSAANRAEAVKEGIRQGLIGV